MINLVCFFHCPSCTSSTFPICLHFLSSLSLLLSLHCFHPPLLSLPPSCFEGIVKYSIHSVFISKMRHQFQWQAVIVHCTHKITGISLCWEQVTPPPPPPMCSNHYLLLIHMIKMCCLRYYWQNYPIYAEPRSTERILCSILLECWDVPHPKYFNGCYLWEQVLASWWVDNLAAKPFVYENVMKPTVTMLKRYISSTLQQRNMKSENVAELPMCKYAAFLFVVFKSILGRGGLLVVVFFLLLSLFVPCFFIFGEGEGERIKDRHSLVL